VYADFVMVVSTHPLLERGICIQRSRAAPPKGEEGEEEGEEEEELEIARVLIQIAKFLLFTQSLSSFIKVTYPIPNKQFMDHNSINLVIDPYSILVERYKVYIALRQEMLAHNIAYPISICKT
ncbi:hypothetical protein Taro_049822, partial [Colocasia esculenta]|nr:hypothetical protein [Colocasia esculenta]